MRRAVREVWPRSFERINLVEPSQSMQRAGQSLVKNLKNLPLIHSYDSIQSLTKNINKSERDHDLVIASYVLGEIPSQQDRITIVRQLWDLTQDVLAILKIPNIGQVLVEPGTPHGFNIISQMRSYILWMEKRKRRKSKAAIDDTSKDLMTLKSGAFVVAPCAHDGRCPLDSTGKYCHFVQRLQRTASQRVYKVTVKLFSLSHFFLLDCFACGPSCYFHNLGTYLHYQDVYYFSFELSRCPLLLSTHCIVTCESSLRRV
ncbi:hypothetical protein RHGRI_028116 [Rhododendron griersonianum]|uniref:Uncharacterized protein n=1 Tax=Rhododendron griersonianum TaxID=479676 RepID=A0AAV6IEG8_9ERIC|nr:hypothetical protein RHGRI_028116 [Rhododendron griersonianum]